ncbi:hypothetical protein CPB83DRAFT_859833 [Crepidotus variabilis]|uniref:BAH domain-containing protein n=1 Tax=Crepidotus variabilis TaxID=179855 RepID=A0A9P6JLG6_9AGAR|nr:hypothetical protein CPB83DRAFT_859833 [Crepidotus variabilis]
MAGSGKKASKNTKATASKVPQDAEGMRNVAPTAASWKNMTVFKKFVVTGKDGENHTYEKGYYALVLPHGRDPDARQSLESYWVARVKDIRAEVFPDGSNLVWVQVQWFYSGKDTSDVVKSFDRQHVGKFERIFSDHLDFVEPEAFDEAITVYKLNETDHEQCFIPEESFFRRYTLEYKRRTLSPKASLNSCFSGCKRPYSPDKTDLDDLMYFCPRPQCRRAWHHSCLLKADSLEKATSSSNSAKPSAQPKPPISKTTIKIPSPTKLGKNQQEDTDTIQVTRMARKQVTRTPKPPTAPQNRKSSLRSSKSQKEREEEEETFAILLPALLTQSTVMEVDLEIQPSKGPPMTLSARALRLLASSPDADEEVDLYALIPSRVADPSLMDVDSDDDAEGEDDSEAEEPSKKRRRGRPPKKPAPRKIAKRTRSSVTTPSRSALPTLLSTIPPELLAIATQPLTRGGAFTAGGVAGNIGMVTCARRLVYAALQMGDGIETTQGWEDNVLGDDREKLEVTVKNAIVKVKVEDEEGTSSGSRSKKTKKTIGCDELPSFLCPSCQGAI